MNGYLRVEELLSDAIGLDPETVGRTVIRNEVDAMMNALKIDDAVLYADRLKTDEKELGRLIEKIVVPETWFFRDRESFKFLRHYAKEICREKSGGAIRVLSAPCSTGEEPYSIAITLINAGLTPGDFVIDAVDISESALDCARRAEYGKTSFRGGKEPPDPYFVPRGQRWRLDARIAGLVNFTHDNILRRGFSSDYGTYGIIFCRNLLIYLNKNGRQRLFECLERSLLPGGLLFAGHSELTSFLQRGYIPVAHSRSFACIKSGENSMPRLRIQESGITKKKVPVKPVEEKRTPEPVLYGTRHRKGRSPGPDQAVDGGESFLSAIRRLADRGFLVQASDLCEKYLRDNGRDKEGFYLMGLIGQALGRPEQAEEMFMKALYLDPSHYEALLHMALLNEQKGDGTRAQIFRQRIKRLEENGKVPGRRS